MGYEVKGQEDQGRDLKDGFTGDGVTGSTTAGVAHVNAVWSVCALCAS